MINDKRIRKIPLFELYIDTKNLVINNTDNIKDNCTINIKDILNVEIIRHLSIINKIIEVMFGFYFPAKSSELRITMENGYKDVILTKCDIEKVEKIVYEVKQLIIEQDNKFYEKRNRH